MENLIRRAAFGAAATTLAFGLVACGGDDEDTAETGDAPTTTEAAADESTTTSAPTEGEGDEGGAPDVNPCAEGESGTLGPATPPVEGATEVAVTAVDYGFEGLEALSSTGQYAVTLTNDGQELHELVIQKIDDDETRPLEELLQEEDPSDFVTDVAFTFACPGATSEPTQVDLETPGRYVALCFIPVGTTPETPPEEFETLGPPHAFQGMIREVTVG